MGQIVAKNAKPKRCNIQAIKAGGSLADVVLGNGEYMLIDSTNSKADSGYGSYDSYVVGDGATACSNLVVHYMEDIKCIDVEDIDDLNTANNRIDKTATNYIVLATTNSHTYKVGTMHMFSDNLGHVLTQVLTTHYCLTNDNQLDTTTHRDDRVYQYFRSCKINGGTLPTGQYVWTPWTDMSTRYEDEEDITMELKDGVRELKLANKSYLPASFSGLGRKYLRKNIVEISGTNKNILTSAMVSDANYVYNIQYDYDLNGQTIELPANSTLSFDGGSLSNGTVVGNNTRIQAGWERIFGNNLIISGTWDVKLGRVEWFDGDFNKCLNSFGGIELAGERTYTISENVVFPFNAIIKGNNATVIPGSNVTSLFVLGYSSKVSDLVIRCSSVVNVFYISCSNLSETYTSRDFYHISCEISVSNVTMVTSTGLDSNNIAAIKLVSNNVNNFTGFWGVNFNNINITGLWNYGIDIYSELGTWITGCTFRDIHASWVPTFLNVDANASTNVIDNFLFERVQVQHSSTSVRFASLSNCSNFFFVKSVPWDWANAPFEVEDSTCSNIILEDTVRFSSNPNQISVNKNTTLPSLKVVFNSAGKGLLTDYIDFSLFSSSSQIQKENIASLAAGDYCYVSSSSNNNKLGLDTSIIRYQSGEFSSLLFRITKTYGRVFVELLGLQNMMRVYTGFLASSTGNLEWEYDSPIDFLTSSEYNALTDINKGMVMFVNNKMAISTSTSINEVRGYDGAKFTAAVAYSRSGLAGLIPSSSADYYLSNKHLIDTSTNREVVFYSGAWRDYDGVDITIARSGTSSNRPTNGIYVGFMYFDTTLSKPIYYTGSGWVDATGTAV